jgi:galactokinase
MLARAEASSSSTASRTWRAPGRVNLIGDHTDYQDGFCLPMAIDRECRVTATPGTAAAIRAQSAQLEGAAEIALDGSTEPGAVDPRWGRFIAGAVRAVRDLGAAPLPAVDLAVTSTVPAGSGLSSSTAFTVALTLAFSDLAGLSPDRVDLARAALAAEVTATGVPAGLMDQMAALFATPGHALLLDCRTMHVDPIPIPRAVGVVVIHSGERVLADSAYAERRAACDAAAARLGLPSLRDATLQQVRDDPLARHVVTENARVLQFATALRAGDVGALGPLMLASHASLRDDFEVSTPALDAIVDACMEHGALGARLTGAGFGGCVVALVQRNHADDLLAKVARATRTTSGHEPLGFSVRAGEPAGRVD